MDMLQAKAELVELAKAFTDKLKEFERHYGLEITDIDIERYHEKGKDAGQIHDIKIRARLP